MSLGRKVFLLVTLALAIAGISVVWLWLQKPNLQVLYTNLSTDDAGAVTAKLRESRVPYELSADGTAVFVPGDKVHELRMQLATDGLPQGGGVGFELFDRTSLGTTEFVQKLNYRRALQGELARTIGQFVEILSARVHLVVPERALFADQREPSRASVVVTLRPGKQLSASQVQGIVHLVASSVEGLTPTAVTVVDSHGQMLSRSSGGSDQDTASAGQLDFQRGLEKTIETKVQTMLERVVGAGKAVVRVSSVLDLRKVEFTEEKFDPDTQVVRSEQRTQESRTDSSTAGTPSGIPGVLSNVPPATPGAESGGGSQNASSKRNEVINYEISKTVSRIVEPTGTIKQLSVAVLVDGTYEAPPDGADGPGKYVPRSEEEMGKLTELVKKAMGFSDARQDQVEVLNVPFETGALTDGGEAPSEAESSLAQFVPYARYGTGLALALIVVLFVIRPILAMLMAAPAAPTGAIGVQLQEAALVPAQPAVRREDVVALTKQNPLVATQVVKKWMKES
ncbi:MAG: flagellar basal-body MS-ring/collar protein FliF [Nitrospirota bacterium]